MTPDVTVIIPAYNSLPYVKRAVASVFEQTLDRNLIEIIAVDDGSTDDTGDELDRIAAEHQNMMVLHEPNSGGPARPRNVALDRASGRYVFFLDADDYLNPEALERMVRTADEQGSDVVLGKLFGVGGRRPPKAMFVTTQLSTNAFDSRVWWALNILKLYRREFIERLGLRFREDLFSEDQPFTGTCFLNAKVISVLADYDYCAFVWREDMGNATLSEIPLERFTDALQAMIELITENVEAGPKRNHLLKRHFEVEYFKIFKAMALSRDTVSVRRTYDLLREWALAHFPYEVVHDLSPVHRVTHSLLLRDRFDGLLDFTRRYVADPGWEVSTEDGRVYALFPDSLDADAGVPAECFEVTDLVKVRHDFNDISWHDGVLHLEGVAYLDLFGASQTEVQLVLRERSTESEYVLPVKRTGSPGYEAVLWQRRCEIEDAGISADIDPLTAADGDRLPDGIWDVLLRFTAHDVTREARIGRVRAPDVDETFRWRLLPAGSPAGKVVGSYFTAGFGNLSLDVGGSQRAGVAWASCEGVAWSPHRKGVLDLSGSLDVIGLDDAATVEVVMRDEAGHELRADTTYGDGRFVASIGLREGAARTLEAGRWTVVLRSTVGGATADLVPRAEQQLAPKWLWRGLWPHLVQVPRQGAPLTLRVARLSPALMAKGLSRNRSS